LEKEHMVKQHHGIQPRKVTVKGRRNEIPENRKRAFRRPVTLNQARARSVRERRGILGSGASPSRHGERTS
jgi:hypothetical protein